MWTRSDLKTRAKVILKQGYWLAFAVCLVIAGISGSASGIAVQIENLFTTAGVAFAAIASEGLTEVQEFAIMLPGMIIGFALVMLVSICLTTPLMVGEYRFFMDMRAGRREFNNIMFGFTSKYKNIVKTMFFMNVKILLWGLLLIIPGIIKSYQYYFVPYLMAENPNMSSKRAFEISKQMSDGEKLNIWVMQLSFMGWLLLGAMLCGVGIVFVQPYYEASFAELYAAMRDKAFHFGFVSTDELPGFGQPYQRQLPQG